MSGRRLTLPQARLLLRVAAADEPVTVSGDSHRVARRLERLGLVRVGVGGSGVAYQGAWWWEAVATPEGLAAVEAAASSMVGR